MGRREGDTERNTLYTDIHRNRERPKQRDTESEKESEQTVKSPRMDMGNGGVLAGLRDHQRSVLGPSRGNPEAFAEEFIPL